MIQVHRLMTAVCLVAGMTALSYGVESEASTVDITDLTRLTDAEFATLAANSGASVNQELFAKAVINEAVRSGTTSLSGDLLGRAIGAFLTAPTLSVEKTAELLAEEMLRAEAKIFNQPGSLQKGPEYSALYLLPYLMEAGMCQGDILGQDGFICGYVNSPTGSWAKGQLLPKSEQFALEIKAAPQGTNLAKIFDLADDLCRSRVDINNSAMSFTADGFDPSQCFAQRRMEGRFIVVRLDREEYIAYVAKLNMEIVEAIENNEDDAGSVLLDKLIEVLSAEIPIEIYGEAYVVTNIQYSVDDSDSEHSPHFRARWSGDVGGGGAFRAVAMSWSDK